MQHDGKVEQLLRLGLLINILHLQHEVIERLIVVAQFQLSLQQFQLLPDDILVLLRIFLFILFPRDELFVFFAFFVVELDAKFIGEDGGFEAALVENGKQLFVFVGDGEEFVVHLFGGKFGILVEDQIIQ